MLDFRIYLVILVASLDAFEKVIWTSVLLDSDLVEDCAADKSAFAVEAIKALVWEAISCATPDIKNARVEVFVENSTHDGIYVTDVLPPDVRFDGWTPELSDIVTNASDQIKDDLAAMLTDMATAHLNGDDGRGDPRYEIRRRR